MPREIFQFPAEIVPKYNAVARKTWIFYNCPTRFATDQKSTELNPEN